MSAIGRLAFATLLALCACASDSPAPRTASPLDPQGVNDGIECVRYSFAADAPKVEAVAAAFGARPFPSSTDRARLADQGLQAAIIRTDDLEAVRTRLGTVTEVFRLPIGQSPAWLQLVRRDLGPSDRLPGASAPPSTEGSVLRLSVRSWLAPDSEAGCAQVEVIAHLAGATTPLAARSGEAPAGSPIAQTFLECCLQQGETLLLLPRPAAPTGKGPATAADLPPTPGMLLLGEPLRQLPDGAPRTYGTVLAISATVPAAMRPAAMPVDSEASMPDTTGEPSAPTP